MLIVVFLVLLVAELYAGVSPALAGLKLGVCRIKRLCYACRQSPMEPSTFVGKLTAWVTVSIVDPSSA